MDGGIFFFFFFCSFKVGERMLYFILFGIYGGSKRDWVFLVEAFSKLEIIRLGIFFFFSFLFRRFHFYLYSFGYFNEIRSSSNWYYVCFRLNIYVINFFLFLPFFFLLSFFIGLCDLLMLFIHGPCSIGYVKYVYSS